MFTEINTLIICALKDEFPEEKYDYPIVYTGLGKINATIECMRQILEDDNIENIINYGSAGGINPSLKGLVECDKFIQRDMDARALGFKLGDTPFDNESYGSIIRFGDTGYTCGTGDSFVDNNNLEINCDVVDMEAYALAKICKIYGLNFKCYKFISDQADSESGKDWKDNMKLGADLFNQKLKTLLTDYL